MLMNITFDVIQSLMLSLVFDDETVKKTKVSIDDTIRVTHNKNGMRTTVEGVVRRIFVDDHHVQRCPDYKPKWIMIVDGSSYACSALERIEIDKILDIDMIKRAEDNLGISSPVGETNITSMRLVGNIVQLSTDNGQTWLKMLTLPAVDTDVPVEDAELASKVEAILPSALRPDLKAELTTDIINLVKTEVAADDPQAPTPTE